MTARSTVPPRSLLRLVCPFVLAVALGVALVDGAHAAISHSEDALSLVVDSTTGDRHLDLLAPGESFQVHAIVDQLSAATLNAFQIGLEYDPSLVPTEVSFHPLQSVSLEPTLTDVYVALRERLLTHEGPHVLATWTFVRLPGFAADHPASVRMRNLENGEPCQYQAFLPPHHLAPLRDAGPVTVGQMPHGVTRLMSTALDHVRDRSYEVEWETFGIEQLWLDGEPVEPSGRRPFVAQATRDHVLAWIDGSTTHEQRLTTVVLTEPWIEELRVDDPPAQSPDIFRVQWIVRGAQAVWWSPGEEAVSARGDRGVTATGPASVTLRAENEWGAVTRSIVLRSGGDPVIAAFWAAPNVIDRGASSLLSWSVVDADRVTLEPLGLEVPTDGSMMVSPDSTLTYSLRAERNGVQTVATCKVEVVEVRVGLFRSDHWLIYPGDPVVLQWQLVNADTAWIEPGVGAIDPISGSLSVIPPLASTEFTLFAENERGQTSARLTTRWKPPFAHMFAHDPTPREFVELRTYVEGADSARVDPGRFLLPTPNGWNSVFVPGGESANFLLTTSNAVGTASAIFRYVAEPPRVQVYKQGAMQYWGGSVAFDVRVHRATNFVVTAPGLLSEPMISDGGMYSRIVLPFWLDSAQSIHVAGENFVGGKEVSSIIEAQYKHHMLNVSVDDTLLQRGSATTLRWTLRTSFRLGPKIRIEPLGIDVPNRAGTMQISPDATTQYRLITTYDGLQYRTLARVVVADGGSSLVAEPMRPVAGTPFDLHVAMPEDAISARLDPGIGAIDPHTQVIEQVIDGVREYVLEVSTPRGVEVARVIVEPEAFDTVSTLVQDLTFIAIARGPRVHLQWNVETAHPATSLQVWKGADASDLSPWTELTATNGEMVDTDVRSGSSYVYLLRLEIDSEVHESQMISVRPELRMRTVLLPNVPNPFNPSTEIRWDLAADGTARLDVYDLRGRLVRTVDLGTTRAGRGSWIWDGLDDRGDPAASGTYLVRLSSAGSGVARKIVLTR